MWIRDMGQKNSMLYAIDFETVKVQTNAIRTLYLDKISC